MTFLGSFPLPLHTHTLKRNQLNNQLPLSQCSGQGKGEADALPCPALPCPVLPCPGLPCPALPCPIPLFLFCTCVAFFFPFFAAYFRGMFLFVGRWGGSFSEIRQPRLHCRKATVGWETDPASWCHQKVSFVETWENRSGVQHMGLCCQFRKSQVCVWFQDRQDVTLSLKKPL